MANPAVLTILTFFFLRSFQEWIGLGTNMSSTVLAGWLDGVPGSASWLPTGQGQAPAG